MTARLVASVAIHDDHSPSRHFSGPPLEAGIEGAQQKRMPWPRLVLVAERGDDVYLERLLADSTVVGDTAHDSIEEAKEQAAWEYGGFLGPWRPVPETLPEELIPGYALGQ